MFVDMSKKIGVCGYFAYKLKSPKQKVRQITLFHTALFITVKHQNRFKTWWSEDTCQLIYFKTFRILNFITKRMRKAVVVSVAAM